MSDPTQDQEQPEFADLSGAKAAEMAMESAPV
jgi:hypothetical protein